MSGPAAVPDWNALACAAAIAAGAARVREELARLEAQENEKNVTGGRPCQP